MSHCAVFGCNNNARYTKGKVNFFRFPPDLTTRSKWIQACRRKDSFNVDNARICSTHFKDEAFWKSMQQRLLNYSPKSRRKLKINAVPTVNLPVSSEEFSRRRKEKSDVKGNRRVFETLLEETNSLEAGNTVDASESLGSDDKNSDQAKGINYDEKAEENPLYLLLAASEMMELKAMKT